MAGAVRNEGLCSRKAQPQGGKATLRTGTVFAGTLRRTRHHERRWRAGQEDRTREEHPLKVRAHIVAPRKDCREMALHRDELNAVSTGTMLSTSEGASD